MRYTENDHDPFGMLLVNRTWQSTTTYKYGFNGQEKDDEIYGNGNLNTAEFWEYDTRLGRRWNIDPKPFVWLSSYVVYINNPIKFSDYYGNIIKIQGEGAEPFTWYPGVIYTGTDEFIIQTVAALELLTHTAGVGNVQLEGDDGKIISGNVISDFTKNGKYENIEVQIWDATKVSEKGEKAHASCDCEPTSFFNENTVGNTIYFNAYEGLNVLPGTNQTGGLQAPMMGLLHEFAHKWMWTSAPIKTAEIKSNGWNGKGTIGTTGKSDQGHEYWILDQVESVAAKLFTTAGNPQAARIYYRAARWADEPKEGKYETRQDISYKTKSSTSTAPYE